MKAILVIDMPTNCKDCDKLVRKGCLKGDYRKEQRPKACPLKPLPQKKILDEELFMLGNFRLIHARFTGWNDCIDTITGETE